jgi:uncharacterized lipoprotein YddW (UPF0748 family)
MPDSNFHRYFLLIFLLEQFIPMPSGLLAGNGDTSDPVRGLWVVRHSITSTSKIDTLLHLAQECGITDLFVQVRGRGDAYYQSEYEPRAEGISDPDFDPLGYILQKTLGDSVRIHAWLNVFYIWSKDTLPKDTSHIVHKQKHWLARPIYQSETGGTYPNSLLDESIEGLYVSPLQADAQDHFLKILIDIIEKYGVAGIHLDYIRYPDRRFDVHPDVVKGFKNRYILNPKQFLINPDLFAQKFSLAGYEVFYYHWRQYLLDGLSDYVKRIADTIRVEYEHLLLSAAVKPDIVSAHWNYYQDWDRWIKEEWLDFVIPMNYSPDEDTFRRNNDKYIELIPQDKYLVGIALYNQPEHQVMRKIKQVMVLENLGFILFSYNQLKKMKFLQSYLRNEL